MDIQVSHQWMDGFVKAAEAHGYSGADIPRLLKLAGIVAAYKRDPATFDASYQATLKQAGWFSKEPPAPAPAPSLIDYVKQLPAVQALMRRVSGTRDFNETHNVAIANSRLKAKRDNLSAILGDTPKPRGGNSYGLYIRPTFMQ